MNTYRCWIVGQKNATQELIQAESSLAARQKIARKYRLAITDAVAQRVEV